MPRETRIKLTMSETAMSPLFFSIAEYLRRLATAPMMAIMKMINERLPMIK